MPANVTESTSTPPLPVTGTPAIKPNLDTAGSNVTTSTNTTTGTSAGTASGTPVSDSSVTTISTIATQLKAAQTTSSDAVFSTSKVNEIKQAISEGRFQVDSTKVAKALIDGMHDLLKSKQSPT